MRHASSIPPQLIAALVPVNTMVALEMRMPASRAKVWHFFLFARVDNKRKKCVDTSVELGHVVVDVRLQNGPIGGADVHNEITEGDPVEALGGAVEGGVV